MLSYKSTKRGFGSCPQCGHPYFTRRKPPNCEECGYDLRGTNQPAPKKPKRNCPSAVLFVGSCHFSCKTSTKDDRCFFIKERESVFCSQQQCRGVARIFQRGDHRQGHHPGIADYIWFISLLSLVYQRAQSYYRSMKDCRYCRRLTVVIVFWSAGFAL